MINGKWGEIRQKFEDDDTLEDIDDDVKKTLMFIEIPESEEEEEKIVEISFSKLSIKNDKNNYTVIARAIPRLYRLKSTDTIMDVKRKIFESMR